MLASFLMLNFIYVHVKIKSQNVFFILVQSHVFRKHCSLLISLIRGCFRFDLQALKIK